METKKAIYLRISLSDGRQESGIQSQKHRAIQYCRSIGIKDEDIEIYEDRISGGKSKRPELDRLLNDCREGKIDTIVAVSISRISRSLHHLINLTKELEDLGVHLISIQENVDFSTSLGKLLLGLIGSIAELEKSTISARVKRGLDYAVASGRVLGAKRTIDRELVKNLSEKGLSQRAISKAMKIAPSSVSRILKELKKIL